MKCNYNARREALVPLSSDAIAIIADYLMSSLACEVSDTIKFHDTPAAMVRAWRRESRGFVARTVRNCLDSQHPVSVESARKLRATLDATADTLEQLIPHLQSDHQKEVRCA